MKKSEQQFDSRRNKNQYELWVTFQWCQTPKIYPLDVYPHHILKCFQKLQCFQLDNKRLLSRWGHIYLQWLQHAFIDPHKSLYVSRLGLMRNSWTMQDKKRPVALSLVSLSQWEKSLTFVLGPGLRVFLKCSPDSYTSWLTSFLPVCWFCTDSW